MTGRPSPRARLEQLLAPEVLAALDDYLAELVDERLAELELDQGGGRAWYTLEEAAELLGCSYDAVRMRAKRGRLETRRHGRALLVSARSVR